MKSIHLSRIDGLLLLMSIVGTLSGITLGWMSLVWIVPMGLMWLFSHEVYSYESRNGVNNGN